MALSESPNKSVLREYSSEKCGSCGEPKKRAESFCRECYFQLPPAMRSALYRRFGSGYEEAYLDAKEWLRCN